MSRRVTAAVCLACLLFGFGLAAGCGGASSSAVSGPTEKQAAKEKSKGH